MKPGGQRYNQQSASIRQPCLQPSGQQSARLQRAQSQQSTPKSCHPVTPQSRQRFVSSPRPSMNQAHLQLSQKQHGFREASSSRFYGGCDVKSKLTPLFDWKGREKNKPKKKKILTWILTWSHTFICLSSTSQEVIPDGQERAQLQIAGLGEKRITMSAYSDAHDICFELCENYPKLSSGGGFELLRVPEGGGKTLDVIASHESGYTVSYLKAVVHHAKIYVRPLQQDLSLDPIEQEVSCQILYFI